MLPRTLRLEWIYLVYLTFFILAVLSPSLYTRGYFGFSEATLEEFTIFVFGMAGLLVFTAYERLMERREQEREQVQVDYRRAKAELIESYAYIGSINRKIELLKKMANDTSMTLSSSRKTAKELFEALAANACAAAGAHSVLLRFVELPKLRTDREFSHHNDQPHVFHVSNKDLRMVHDQGLRHTFVHAEDGKEVLVIPSDRPGTCKAYMLLSWHGKDMPELDTSLLKVFVNQAEMLYQQLVMTSEAAATMLAETTENR